MFLKFIRQLFVRKPIVERRAEPERKPWPSKDDIALLPVFDGLKLQDIELVVDARAAQAALQALENSGTVGFDTESKPTFVKGDPSTGPHVAQFSTLNKAYVFLLHDPAARRAACQLISNPALKKVGFGLGDDLRRIVSKLGVEPRSVLDIETLFRERHYGRGVGVKVGVALVFKRRFLKSKRAATSNWKNQRLTDKQILYAANDAYAAIRVYDALEVKKIRI